MNLEQIQARIAAARQQGAGLRIVSHVTDEPDQDVISCADLKDWHFFDVDDMVLGVGSGMPLIELHRKLAQHRMRLRLNGWFEGETIGAAYACYRVGPDRLWDGGIRDAVIGLSYIDGLGRSVKAGGKVVKNVTGYDLMRMLLGSLGGLGFMTALNFKMMPEPVQATTLLFQDRLDHLLKGIQTFTDEMLPLEWVAIRKVSGEDQLVVGISGNAARQLRLRDDLQRILGEMVNVFPETEATGALAWTHPEQRLTACLQDLAQPEHQLHLHFRVPHSLIGHTLLRHLYNRADAVQLHPFAADGHLFFSGDALPNPDEVRQFIALLESQQGSLSFERIPPSWQGEFRRWQPHPPGFALMQALKRHLDPDGVFVSPFYEV
jgi:hypothetical protein